MDALTMLLVLALGNLALAATLFFFDPEQARSAPLALWNHAKQGQALAWLLLALGGAGVMPDWLAVAAGYPLLFGGVALEAGAQWQAGGRAGWRLPLGLALGAAMIVFFGAWLIDEGGLRALVAAALLGGFYLLGAAALAHGWRQRSLLQRFLTVATAVLALLVAARGLLVLTMPAGWGWLSHGLLRQLSSGALYLLMLLNGFGVLLLARERLQAELARLQLTDPLTDVPNQRGFYRALTPWMALARRPGQPASVILFDLDQFQRINDGYGHPVGDTVLRHIAGLSQRQLRDSDLLGRLSGVEFAILLPRTGQDEALLVAERVRAAIAAHPVKTARALITVTASFGVTTIRADDSAVTLLHRAANALRAAKQAGRNRVGSE